MFLCYWRVFRMRENQKYKRVKEELDHVGEVTDAAALPGGKPIKRKGYDWKYVVVVVVH